MAPKATRKNSKVTVELGNPKPKKSVTRYDCFDNQNDALQNVYVDKAALEQLGNPDRIRITIEAA